MGAGGLGECERRFEVFVKMPQKNRGGKFWVGGGGRVWGGGVRVNK